MELKDLLREYKYLDEKHCDYISDFYLITSAVLNMATSGLTPYVDVDDKRVKRIRKMMAKHISGVPVQKVIGYSYFYDCYIPYSKHTLTPRMETELLVEKICDYIGSKHCKVLDMCAGSGCIGIAVAKHTGSEVVLADVSDYAIKECKTNAKLNFVKVDVIKSNMFDRIAEKFDIIVCNPPYITEGDYDKLDYMVKNYDPKLALVGGSDGLDYYKIIATKAPEYLVNGGRLFLEIGYDQGEAVKGLLETVFDHVDVIKDYSGNDRIIVAYDMKN